MRRRPQHEGTLTPAIEAFVTSMVATELSPDQPTQEELRDTLKCPVVKAAITVTTLLGLSYFGEFTHSDEKIQSFIRGTFAGMRGDFTVKVAQLFSATWAGCSIGEWGVRQAGKRWHLDRILVLQPRTYTFLGTLGELTGIRYYGTRNIDIPYSQVLHVRNAPHFSFNDPAGFSDLTSAIAAVKAWKILMSELIIAGQRQATPLTAGFYDPESPDIPVVDDEGNPVLNMDGEQRTQSPESQMSEQLSDLENKSTVVTSSNNEIRAIANQADVTFFTEALRMCHKLIFLSFLFPETGLEAIGSTGSGDSNLNKGHMALLHQNVEQLANQIKRVLIEDMVRPLIEFNFGKQADYGNFPAPEGKDDDRIQLFNAITSAISQQVFPIDDLNIINKLYDLAGLPQVDELPASDDLGFSLTTKDLNYWRFVNAPQLS